jgi:hypothetical protein
MSVKFKSVERVNPRDLTLPKKYYAQIINGDDVSFDELAGLISKVSSLNYGEVLGVLGTLDRNHRDAVATWTAGASELLRHHLPHFDQ